jgi:Fe-S cluster assembly ATP-binding protein
VLLITHYTRILRYVRPDFVHVFVGGKIVAEGGPELADELEASGYERFSPLADPVLVDTGMANTGAGAPG